MVATPELMHAYSSLVMARPGYDRADAFYDGDVEEVFASQRIRRLLAKTGAENVDDFNYAKIPVDTVANRLDILDVVAQGAGDGSDPEDTEAETDAQLEAANQAIEHLWERNELDAESDSLHLDVSKHGDAYLIVWPVRDDSGEVVDVDMLVNSAHTVRVIYSAENPLEMAYAIKSWEVPGSEDGKPRVRATMYYPDRIEKWITDGTDPEDPKAWAELVDEDGAQVDNPYGIIPVFHFRNNRPYGLPEHKGAYGPQQMISKLVTSHASVIDFQSFPQRYYLVDPKLDDPTQNFEDSDHPEDDAEDPESELSNSGLSADPAAVWRLFAARSAGQFEPAQPGIFLEPFDRYIKSMAELTDTPQHHFSKSTGDTPSGQALRALEGPTIKKVQNRQSRYEPIWIDAFLFALQLLGVEGVKLDVQWAPVEIVADSEGWQVVSAKIAAGVPVEVALAETGYSGEQVDEWVASMDGADFDRRVDVLVKLSTAVQALGAGVALGVVGEEQVRQVVDRFVLGTMAGTGPEIKPGKYREPPPAGLPIGPGGGLGAPGPNQPGGVGTETPPGASNGSRRPPGDRRPPRERLSQPTRA